MAKNSTFKVIVPLNSYDEAFESEAFELGRSSGYCIMGSCSGTGTVTLKILVANTATEDFQLYDSFLMDPLGGYVRNVNYPHYAFVKFKIELTTATSVSAYFSINSKE